MPQLRIKEGHDAGKTCPLSGEKFTIGRAPECDLILEEGSLASRHHASLYATPEGWRVKDLDSLNGTLINDQKLRDSLLNPGDRIDIGGVVIALLSVYLGGIATGQRFDRYGRASHPTTSTADVPVEDEEDDERPGVQVGQTT